PSAFLMYFVFYFVFVLLFILCSCLPRHLHSFLHDALPISPTGAGGELPHLPVPARAGCVHTAFSSCPRWPGVVINVERTRPYGTDRKSTRLNSSHVKISYAVFCLKKKKIDMRKVL